MNRIKKATVMIFVIAVALAFSAVHESSAATSTPVVSVEPSNLINNSPSYGMKFDINITIQNVSDCGSVQIALDFNGSLIAIVGESFLPSANLPSPSYFQSGNGFMDTNVTFGIPISSVSPVAILDLTFKLYGRYCESVIHIDSLVVADSSGNIVQSSSQDGNVQIRLIGDLNKDGAVNLLDAIIVGNAFGTSDPNADLNGDGIVNILDAIILSGHFGT